MRQHFLPNLSDRSAGCSTSQAQRRCSWLNGEPLVVIFARRPNHLLAWLCPITQSSENLADLIGRRTSVARTSPARTLFLSRMIVHPDSTLPSQINTVGAIDQLASSCWLLVLPQYEQYTDLWIVTELHREPHAAFPSTK